jgi:hypothetical protein
MKPWLKFGWDEQKMNQTNMKTIRWIIEKMLIGFLDQIWSRLSMSKIEVRVLIYFSLDGMNKDYYTNISI